MSKRLERGIMQIYTGNGKGKTTAAFGLALRAASYGLNIAIIQFMKVPQECSEAVMLQKLAPQVEVYTNGTGRFVELGSLYQDDMEIAKSNLDLLAEILQKGEHDLVIADEICNALHFDLLSIDEVLPVLAMRSDNTEVVLTGRNAPVELVEIADLVTDMTEVKHPYQQGVFAREGIDF